MGLMETPAKWPYGELPAAAAATGAAPAPRKLEFELSDACKASVAKADAYLEQTLGGGVDLHPAVFEGFGKSAIKQMGHSPDAFVQMAYQLAYSREHGGKSAPTYEACSTAGAFHGRTETIRSCSPESAALVAACINGTASPELLSQATAAQAKLSRSAAFGEGIDRHLLGLSKFAKMDGSDEALALFSDPLHSRTGTWVLSTSNVGSPWLDWFAFGPQCDPGFGLGTASWTSASPLSSRATSPVGARAPSPAARGSHGGLRLLTGCRRAAQRERVERCDVRCGQRSLGGTAGAVQVMNCCPPSLELLTPGIRAVCPVSRLNPPGMYSTPRRLYPSGMHRNLEYAAIAGVPLTYICLG